MKKLKTIQNKWAKIFINNDPFIQSLKSDIEELFKRIQKLEQHKHDVMWHFDTSFFLNNISRDKSLKILINNFDKDYFNEEQD